MFSETQDRYSRWCEEQEPPLAEWGRHTRRFLSLHDLSGISPDRVELVFLPGWDWRLNPADREVLRSKLWAAGFEQEAVAL